MSHIAFRTSSDAATHGLQFAFDAEIKRQLRRGNSPARAFALAAQFVFGRYVPAR